MSKHTVRSLQKKSQLSFTCICSIWIKSDYRYKLKYRLWMPSCFLVTHSAVRCLIHELSLKYEITSRRPFSYVIWFISSDIIKHTKPAERLFRNQFPKKRQGQSPVQLDFKCTAPLSKTLESLILRLWNEKLLEVCRKYHYNGRFRFLQSKLKETFLCCLYLTRRQNDEKWNIFPDLDDWDVLMHAQSWWLRNYFAQCQLRFAERWSESAELTFHKIRS